MGFKAMIHTLASKARGFPATSIGSLLNEPFTGVVYLNGSGIATDFKSLKGKRIGYAGEFGEVRRLSLLLPNQFCHEIMLSNWLYRTYITIKPEMASAVNTKIFERSYAYFSKDMKIFQRDWEKVTKYGKRLGVLQEDFSSNLTSKFLGWKPEGESADPMGDQKKMVSLQKEVADKGGFQRLVVKIAV